MQPPININMDTTAPCPISARIRPGGMYRVCRLQVPPAGWVLRAQHGGGVLSSSTANPVKGPAVPRHRPSATATTIGRRPPAARPQTAQPTGRQETGLTRLPPRLVGAVWGRSAV